MDFEALNMDTMHATTRQRIEKDKDSWLNYLTPAARSVVLFVHGTFGDATETWGGTPDVFLTIPSMAGFDIASFGYESKKLDTRQPALIAEKLRLWINTHLHQYTDIYIVAHSMGGLLARQMLCTMMENEHDHNIVKKIRLCFLIASPVTGSSYAKLAQRIPFLARFHKRISYLADPRINGLTMGKAYKRAVKMFKDKGGQDIDVPRFHIFTAESDKWVGRPDTDFYTDYDNDEGVIPGTHSTSKIEQDVNSSLVNRVSQLILKSSGSSVGTQASRIKVVTDSMRERELAAQSSTLSKASSKSNANATDILLISCSNTKSDAAGDYYASGDSLVDQLANLEVRQHIFATRNNILVSIQSGYVDGVEFSEGNRIAKPMNKQLNFGQDIGGLVNERLYLPAYARYKGRCYQATLNEWKEFLEKKNKPHILIMSGLYGLLLVTDPIQNYDIHLTDVVLDKDVSVQSLWKDRELMTEALLSHIMWIENNVGPVGNIVDALSELSYQETINWSMVRHRYHVFHRVFENNAGRNALGNLGIWIRDVIRNPDMLKDIEEDKFYDNQGFTSPDRIAFERIIGESKLPVARQVN